MRIEFTRCDPNQPIPDIVLIAETKEEDQILGALWKAHAKAVSIGGTLTGHAELTIG